MFLPAQKIAPLALMNGLTKLHIEYLVTPIHGTSFDYVLDYVLGSLTRLRSLDLITRSARTCWIANMLCIIGSGRIETVLCVATLCTILPCDRTGCVLVLQENVYMNCRRPLACS